MANLADVAFQTRFVEKGLEVYKNWPTLAPSERAKTLIGELNNILTNSLQIPAVKTNMGENLDPGTCGQLDFTTWTIQLSPQSWSKRAITLEEMGDYCVTIYHETRHAEQWYRVGQGVAAGVFVPAYIGPAHRFGPTSRQIADALGIELGIAMDMERKKRFFNLHVPLPMVPLVRGWFESIYGTGSAHRNAALRGTTQKDFIDYRHLPEEADAHKVEQSVRAIWKQKEPDEGLLEGVSGLFKPELVHYQEWVAKTSRNVLHFRSGELTSVDHALQVFDGSQTPAHLLTLRQAFDKWYKRNPKEATTRNQDNCVQRLKTYLDEAA